MRPRLALERPVDPKVGHSPYRGWFCFPPLGLDRGNLLAASVVIPRLTPTCSDSPSPMRIHVTPSFSRTPMRASSRATRRKGARAGQQLISCIEREDRVSPSQSCDDVSGLLLNADPAARSTGGPRQTAVATGQRVESRTRLRFGRTSCVTASSADYWAGCLESVSLRSRPLGGRGSPVNSQSIKSDPLETKLKRQVCKHLLTLKKAGLGVPFDQAVVHCLRSWGTSERSSGREQDRATSRLGRGPSCRRESRVSRDRKGDSLADRRDRASARRPVEREDDAGARAAGSG
jgi:hypothetical protein